LDAAAVRPYSPGLRRKIVERLERGLEATETVSKQSSSFGVHRFSVAPTVPSAQPPERHPHDRLREEKFAFSEERFEQRLGSVFWTPHAAIAG